MLYNSGYFAIISTLIAVLCICPSEAQDEPTVKTSNGLLKGKYLTSRNGNLYEAFLGIRFATVPDRFEVVQLLILVIVYTT